MTEVEDRWKLPAWVPAFAVFVTVGGGFWWAANMQSRIDYIEQHGSPSVADLQADIKTLATRVMTIEVLVNQIPVNGNRITRLETQLDDIRKQLDRIEAQLRGGTPH